MKRPGIHPDPVPESNLRALQEQVTRTEASQSEYKQLEDCLKKKVRQQSLLLETAQSLTASLDSTEVLRQIAAGAVKVVEASSCDLYLLEPDGQTLVPVISIDPEYPDEILSNPLLVDNSLTGQCIREKRCLIFNDPSNHPGHFQVPGTPVEPEERIITAPLIADDRAWGALCINRSGADFTQEDLELSQAYAALAASVLKNAQTHTDLTREMEERRKVEQALSESEEHFRSLVQQSLEGIILIDETGKYIEWNDTMQVITGIPRQEVLGKMYWDVQFRSMPPDSRTPEMYERVKKLTLEALKTGKASFFERGMEVTFQRADGALRTVQQMAFPIRTSQGYRIGGTYNDITERKFALESLQYRTEQVIRHQQVLLRLNKTDPTNLPAILHKVTEELAQALRVDRAGIWVFTHPERDLRCEDLYLRPEERHTTGNMIPAGQYPRFFATLEKMRVIPAQDACTDVNTQELTDSYLRPLGITSMLNVPIRATGKIAGVISIEHVGIPRQWSLEEQDFAASIADIVALALEAAERKRTEAALRESESKYRELTDNLPLVVFEADMQGRLTFANRYAYEKTGYSPEDFANGLSVMQILTPEDRPRALQNMQHILKGQASQGHEYLGLTKEGVVFPVVIYSQRISRGKKTVGLRGFALDIGEQKLAQQALQASEKKYRDLTNFLPQIIFELDLKGNVTFVNKFAHQLMGYNSEDVKAGLNAYQMVIESERPRIVRNLQRLLSGDRFPAEEFTLRRKDGSTFPAIILAVTAKEEGSAVGFRGVVIDITERKEAEDALRKSEESYRGLFDSVNEAIYIQDSEGVFLDVNAGAVRMYGYPREFFIGQTPEVLSAPGRNNLERVIHTVQSAFSGKPQHFEFWGKRASGEIFPKEIRLYPGMYFGQHVVIAMAADITERKKAEAALRDSEARYRYYIEHVSDGVWCFQFEDAYDLARPLEEKIENAMDTVVVECNAAYAKMIGQPREQILGKRLKDLISDSAEYRAYIKRFFDNGCRIDDIEIVTNAADGSEHWLLMSMFGEVLDGMLMNVWGRQTDITERKKVQSQVHRANLDLFEAYDATLEGWSHALEMRERETAGHSQRVAEMTLLLARTLGVSGEPLIHIRRGALLHDIGKMGIPDSILLKPSPLSPDEWVVMHQHPTYAYLLLSSIPYLVPALDIPYSHHERWDGNGYPRGLRGEEIPLAARIFAVVDVWDALTSNRPYRPAWASDPARRYLEEQSGIQFDPHIVESFLRMV